MNPGTIWKSDWFIGAVVFLLFLLGHQFGAAPLTGLENSLYDLVSNQQNEHAGDQIAIIHMDEKAASATEQRAMASVISKLSGAGAKLIGMDVLYREAEPAEAGGLSLATAVQNAGNVVIPMMFNAGEANEYSNTILPAYMQRMMIKHANETGVDATPLKAAGLYYPYAGLSQAAAGVGHMGVSKGVDGMVRSQPLVIEFSGHHFPSLALALATQALHIPLDDVRINLGEDIEVGALNIPTDAALRAYPTFYYDEHGNSFSSYAFSDIATDAVPAAIFKNKIVLIGSSAPHANIATAANENMSRIEFNAHMLQSILKDQLFKRPAWASLLETALLALIGLYLIFLLPGLNRSVALVASASLFAACIAAGIIMSGAYSIWIQTLSAALMLLIGHALFYLQQLNISRGKQQQSTSSLNETNKMLGLSFQSQGMLDKAYEKFLACPVDAEMLSIFYELAQAFERKRQFAQAIDIYQHISKHDPTFRDVQTRMANAKNSNEALTDRGSNSGLSSLLVSGEERPILGRYEIISELGKGAMGTVYLGKDPKINRNVAIKTMALSQEFEPDELEEVKAKFFHEAEIAGMLNHPNIVTIFDAGDEHDLAYIAMEYLDGIDLVPYTKNGKLLPITTTLKITAKVAEALQYAHDHGVIHRDIKPANIMILKNKTVKVTDFGIAHINESSKTKAGVVLGTPSYMSPEQLSGKELDGRSDLFSLGVMMYELVCGIRPFRGDSISKLMFKIAKEPHVNVREHNRDVPDCVSTLIDSMLAKKVDLRIETAGDVLNGIQHCLRELKQGSAQ